ncbi:LutB/LldF family L-lactate oxidation iron-sulfur protein [Glycomyces algeriensis]|uniref:Iron-sulfur cluster-binding protein n=1 Tax=Glycomyces algeriensis TaxID=256037 RepID=A0A9W6G601_9ACTN|nr:LutB/LldF family L-lactate oxidation iron-sulfur protein [Glycomyces algeriensis]MDA1368966.1 LutB/LldF family L-lactate oxidation iron-sulfur protein [Glycomyces algeriensis]MDR7353291.1 L-lactate dehydrogenase complex protein LldF [Glycomyces algeriensis]GLI40987.1 iron-sulfur cluster-binding protein [Glycomyces algeriensis]
MSAEPSFVPAASLIPADAPFPKAAKVALGMPQLRKNLAHATGTIRAKRAAVAGELDDWEALRDAAAAIKADVQHRLPELAVEFERNATAAGAHVHWARDAKEANEIAARLVREAGADDVVKVKSMATQEIELNEHFEAVGLKAYETDLAELIVQLAEDKPSHILVPAIHYNRTQIREIFDQKMGDAPAGLTDEPAALAEAARLHLRRRFLSAKVAVSGANFAVAETGSLVVVESEGNGRMCLTMPETLISIVGIEKLLPRFTDLEVFMQLLPRSSTGERMNPYTSVWTGSRGGDGPKDVHVILLDNGRTNVLADEVGRQALSCIRCSACLNVCPVYERTGGHAYGHVYPGPIGAILAPQLEPGRHDDLPYASSLCGACYEVCPVKINIPEVLVHLRQQGPHQAGEQAAMRAATAVMARPRLWRAALRGARLGSMPWRRKGFMRRLPWPGSRWTVSRDLPVPPKEDFRDWWKERGR